MLLCFLGEACSPESDFTVSSPDGQLKAIVIFDKEQGTVHYSVQSREQEIISSSSMGISTSLGDFASGMLLKGYSKRTIDETYNLPQGKVSTYRNYANEQTLTLRKNGQQLAIVLRVYNDGFAYRYEIPGKGEIELNGEISSINLADTNLTCYGQNHPNRYGYESALGPIDGERMSNPVLAHLKDKNHFVLMGQAATNGNYVQSHFQRSDNRFTYSYPLDQEKIGPVHAVLPFQSPWRMVIISSKNPGKIVESYMADAGFANRWGGADSVLNIIKYADTKKVGVIGWAHTREFDTREKADSTMKRYADWGLKGAKIDFFDNNTLSDHPKDWRDYEDTQQSLQMRDWIFKLGIEYSFLLELHGNTIPTGERRQYPNLMTLEGVDGMERRTKPAANDLTIPYVRNVMGPVSYTVIHFERSPGTQAYQLAMPIVYEAGLMIYAEHGKKLLEWPGREMIKDVPSTWDEIKYLEGMPASHIVIARRKGEDWYIGGMTDAARTVNMKLDFLKEGKKYHALILSDDTHTTMKSESKLLTSSDDLSINLLERGGFALRLIMF